MLRPEDGYRQGAPYGPQESWDSVACVQPGLPPELGWVEERQPTLSSSPRKLMTLLLLRRGRTEAGRVGLSWLLYVSAQAYMSWEKNGFRIFGRWDQKREMG